jgi:hypothetical protein
MLGEAFAQASREVGAEAEAAGGATAFRYG